MNMTNIQQLLNDPTLVSKMMTALFGYYDENHPLSEDQKKGLEYVLWRWGTPSPDDLSIRKWANSFRYPYIMRIILKGYSELSDMGAFTDKEEWNNYTRAIHKYPNVLWTHHADMIAAHIIER